MGVDSWTGEVVWRIYVSDLVPLEGDKLLLYTQRTSAHFPHEPQCVVIGKNGVRKEGDGLVCMHVCIYHNIILVYIIGIEYLNHK